MSDGMKHLEKQSRPASRAPLLEVRGLKKYFPI